MKSFVAALFVATANGHGVMYEPPTRNAQGLTYLMPGCPGGSCLWFNQGISIGCPEPSGRGAQVPDVFPGVAQCLTPDEPTLAYTDSHLRTCGFPGLLGDWCRVKPWRKPGSGPLIDPCGLGGGWHTPGEPGNGGKPAPGYAQGASASEMPPLIDHQTIWVAGETAEVAWGVYANHGGGYAYRLCPRGEELTEACFQRHHLQFDGEMSWIQGGYGMDPEDRREFRATQVAGALTVPEGSTWRRNPIPACGGNIINELYLGAFNGACPSPIFPSPFPDTFGFGGGACGSNVPTGFCTEERFKEVHFTFGVVDKVRVPDLPEGDYVLSFRWDVEQTPQIWNSCADVTIVRSGAGTRPFREYIGCETCCEREGLTGICARCRACQDDRTGDCASCWEVMPGYNPRLVPDVMCLGHDDPETGGPTRFLPGDPRVGGMSPGCTRCWRDGLCDAVEGKSNLTKTN